MDWIQLAPEWGQVASSCECGHEPSDSTKCGEYLDQLSNLQLLKQDSVVMYLCTEQIAQLELSTFQILCCWLVYRQTKGCELYDASH